MYKVLYLHILARELLDSYNRVLSFGDEKSEYAAATYFGFENVLREARAEAWGFPK